MIPLIAIICIIALIIASYTDLKTREVPDWLNYSLIGIGLGVNAIYSIVSLNFSFIIQSILGLIVGLGIAYSMFYLGQWGGGDSKMIMGLGALIGLELSIKSFLLGLFINILLIGSIYGLIWSIILARKNKNRFTKEIKKIINNKKLIRSRLIIFIGSLLLLSPLFLIDIQSIIIPIILLIILINLTPYLWIFVRAVENSSMYKRITPDKLTEGDWIANNIRIDGKYISGPKDLGIEKKQINQLIDLWKKGKIKKVLIKEGMPFIPSFFIAFIITLIYGNLFIFFIS
jgi:Flp pilus assembly protein protease CpaA